MSEYLLPICELTIAEKQKMFSIKNRMVDIPANFPANKSTHICACGQIEDMKHVYNCEEINGKQKRIQYEEIYTGKLDQQTEVMRNFEQSLVNRNNLINHCKSPCDPSVIRCSRSIG